jgi:hypothetical protein
MKVMVEASVPSILSLMAKSLINVFDQKAEWLVF